MIVRETTSDDFAEVRRILIDGFGQPGEADLVEALRDAGEAIVDLVAEDDGAIVGHVLMSALRAPANCLALAPVCAAPHRQGQGVGAALVREALERAKSEGWQAVFVLGDPGYYTRFGFSTEAAAKFETSYPKAYFMALELAPSALTAKSGPVVYAAPFLDLE
jgi:putative acetyltransferase